MCIVFVAFWPKAEADKGQKYRLVVASNRDEFFHRPARTAHLWDDKSGILAGMDMMKGKEGGGWLGASERNGRFAVITNVRQAPAEIRADAKGRGYLVIDFLRGSMSPLAYGESLAQSGHDYNGFNLLLADMSGEGSLCYYGNKSGQAPKELPAGIYGLSNAFLDTPWLKVEAGKTRLAAILEDTAQNDDQVKEQLFALLDDRTKHFPDPLVPSVPGIPDAVVCDCSSVFVECKPLDYGTRAQTVFTVDAGSRVSFSEKSLASPITSEHMVWTSSDFKYPLSHL